MGHGHNACSEEDLQLQRLMERNSMPEASAKKRISAQMSLERKCEQAHFVVENSGTMQDTREQVHTYTVNEIY
jgi:dephospho-CoA kinase